MNVFERIVCGVDTSPAGKEALRQAKRLLAPGGTLLAVTAYEPTAAAYAAWQAPMLTLELQRAVREAAADAAAEIAGVPRASARLVEGHAVSVLRSLAAQAHATLLVVGSHDHGRAAGVLLGSVATRLLHDAPCPVLVTRPPSAPVGFPRAIVVGVDGSPSSLEAEEVARELGARVGAPVTTLVATGGKPVDVDGLRRLAGLEWTDLDAVDALVQASAGADLVVVGSRGLHGLAALGSVSERVAHAAASSVLVVRQVPVAVETSPRARAAVAP